MTCIGKLPRGSACLDMVTLPSSSLDTVPRPRSMTCLGKVPRPSAMQYQGKVPRPSAIPRNCASAYCHDMPRKGASTYFMPTHGDSA